MMTLTRSLCIGLALFFLLGATKCSEKQKRESANDLIDAFSSGCGKGPWTQAALARASQLTSIYQSLLSKASCSGNPNVQRALGAAQGLEAELRALQGMQARSQARGLEEASNDLLLSIQGSSDPTMQSALISQYAAARYQLSIARANADYINNPDPGTRLANGMASMSARFRDLLSASSELAECYSRNPGVATQLGISLAELGGSFAPPLVGLAVSGVANLLKVGVQAAVLAPSAKAVYNTYSIKMPTALTCGLEALTRDYCKARDARTLLDLSRKGRDEQLNPFFRGIELQDRFMPALYGWLDQVVYGNGRVRNSNQAEVLNFQFRRLSRAQNDQRLVQGIISELETKLRKRPVDPGTEISYLKGMLRSLVKVFYPHENNSGPMADNASLFNGFESAADFIRALAPQRDGIFPPNLGNPDYEGLISAMQLQSGDLVNIQRRFFTLFDQRYAEVMADFNEKVHVVAQSTVRDASRIDAEGLSPLGAWNRLHSFLEQYAYAPGLSGQQDRIIISEFRARIDEVFRQLNDPASVSDVCVDDTPAPRAPGLPEPPRSCVTPAGRVLTNAYSVFKLENNNVFLPTMVSGLVTSDIVTRYRRGDAPRQLKDLYRLSGQDLGLLLNRAGLTPAAVRADISEGQSITTRSLSQFRDFYLGSIARAMEDLKETADENKEPPAGNPGAPNRDLLSRLCILTYVSGMSWPEEIPYSLCSGARIVSDGKLAVSLAELRKKLEGKPLDARICSYENFLRADRLSNQEIQPPGSGELFHDAAAPAERREFWQRVLDGGF